MAATFYRLGHNNYIGMQPGNRVTFALSSATSWLAFRIPAPASLTLNWFVIAVNALAGSGGSLVVRVETDSAGAPSGTLATGAAQETFTPSTAGAAQTQKITLANPVALTAGTMYWIVIQNGDASPATNYATLISSGGLTAVNPFSWATTTTGTWTAPSNSTAPMIHFGFSDGSEICTLPVQAGGGVTARIWGTGGTANQIRLRYRPKTRIKLTGFGCYQLAINASAGDLVCTVTDASNTVLGSATLPNAGLSNNKAAAWLFPTPIYIPANTEFRVTFSATAGDASHWFSFVYSQNGFQPLVRTHLGLLAFEATTDGGASWADASPGGANDSQAQGWPYFDLCGDLDGLGSADQDSTTRDGGSGSSLRLGGSWAAGEYSLRRFYLAGTTGSKTYSVKMRRSSTDVPTLVCVRLYRGATLLATLTADANANDTFYTYTSGSLSLTAGDVIEIRYVVQKAAANTNGYGWFDSEAWS